MQNLLPFPCDRMECLDHSFKSMVFLVADGIVAKLRKFPRAHGVRRLRAEFEISCQVYAAGISSPRPLGMFSVDTGFGPRPAYVMELITGDSITDLDREAFADAQLQLASELERASTRGFVPSLDASLNAKYNGGIVLYDFEYWSRG